MAEVTKVAVPTENGSKYFTLDDALLALKELQELEPEVFDKLKTRLQNHIVKAPKREAMASKINAKRRKELLHEMRQIVARMRAEKTRKPTEKKSK